MVLLFAVPLSALLTLLITVVVGLLVIGLIFWATRTLCAAFGVPEPVRAVILVLLVVVVVIIILYAVLGGGVVHGQTPEKAVAPPPTISCKVGDLDEDRARIVLCDGFEPTKFLVWPKEWEDFKSKGETVKLQVVDGKAVPVVHSCAERIRKRFNQRIGLRTSIDEITPSDCLGIPAAEREKMAKGQ